MVTVPYEYCKFFGKQHLVYLAGFLCKQCQVYLAKFNSEASSAKDSHSEQYHYAVLFTICK